MKQLRTKLNMSSAYHPQTDGQTKRTHRTNEQILRGIGQPLSILELVGLRNYMESAMKITCMTGHATPLPLY
jgi:hypothetical protein